MCSQRPEPQGRTRGRTGSDQRASRRMTMTPPAFLKGPRRSFGRREDRASQTTVQLSVRPESPVPQGEEWPTRPATVNGISPANKPNRDTGTCTVRVQVIRVCVASATAVQENRERASRLRFRHRPPSARGDATNLFATFLYTVARRSKSSASGDRDARQVVGGGEKVEALRPAHPRRRRRRRPRATGATAGAEGPVPPPG